MRECWMMLKTVKEHLKIWHRKVYCHSRYNTLAMQVVMLVGGLGTKLRPLTFRIPKPLVPVMGRPLMMHVIE